MSNPISTVTKACITFPALAVEASLKAELLSLGEMLAGMEGKTFPTSLSSAMQDPCSLDSLAVVDILCALDELVGFDLPDRVVRAGGYESIGEALEHLMPRIEKEWQKRHGGTT